MKQGTIWLSLLAICFQFCAQQCTGNTVPRTNIPVVLSPKSSTDDGSGQAPSFPTDDEDASVGIGVGASGFFSGYSPPTWRPPSGGGGGVSGDGDFRWPTARPALPRRNATAVVGISLPVLLPATPPPSVTAAPPGREQQRPVPTPRAKGNANALSCSRQSSGTSTAQSMVFQSRFRPVCQASNPELYQPQQCGSGTCFCVDEHTGNFTDGTAVSINRQLSCLPIAFSVTLGFNINWHESMGQTTTVSFHKCAQIIEDEMNLLFADYQGLQKATVLRLRPGSVIADIRLTSIGHPPNLKSNVQDLKQLLDNKIASRTFAGMEVIPKYYFFQREGADANWKGPGEGGSSQSSSSGRTVEGGNSDTSRNEDTRSNSNAESGEGSGSAANDGGDALSAASLFSSPGIVAAIASGGIGLILLVVLLALFCAYRARKASEGSYKVNGAKNGAKNSGAKNRARNGAGAGAANGKRPTPGMTEPAYVRAPSNEFYA